LSFAVFHGGKLLFAMQVAVLVPPLRLLRLGGESRDDALGLFLQLLVHLVFSRNAFLSETLAGKAVMARTLPLRIVHTTDNKRPPHEVAHEQGVDAGGIDRGSSSTFIVAYRCIRGKIWHFPW
jgi:hypothetical protein